ncbi:MAG: 50S ribosomal protein L9 [Firmicutes bacterium]|nr:50S ribosomal protein L9 [Bacillota bacterium]
MKVILLQDVKSLGKRGDVKEVADGYARNYLIAKGFAQPASKGNLNILDHEIKMRMSKEAQLIDDAEHLAKKVEGKTFVIPAKAGEAGKLFGSVTTADIAAVLSQQGYDVDKRKIEIPVPIKALGMFEAVLKLHSKVSAKIQLDVRDE